MKIMVSLLLKYFGRLHFPNNFLFLELCNTTPDHLQPYRLNECKSTHLFLREKKERPIKSLTLAVPISGEGSGEN